MGCSSSKLPDEQAEKAPSPPPPQKESEAETRTKIKNSLISSDDSSFNYIKSIARTELFVNFKDENGLRPMHLVCKSGNLRMLQFLVQNKANINECCRMKNTPLHYAIGFHKFDCAMQLKLSGANENAKNMAGFAAKSGFDGESSFGLAALYSATTHKQAEIAFNICTSSTENLSILKFLDATARLRKILGPNEWDGFLQQMYEEVLQKLKLTERGYEEMLLVSDIGLEDSKADAMCNASVLSKFRCV